MRLWGRQAQQGPCMLATPSLPVGLHVPPAGLSDPGEQVEHRHRLLGTGTEVTGCARAPCEPRVQTQVGKHGHTTQPCYLCRAGFAEDIPEPQGLVPSSSDDGLPIRGHGLYKGQKGTSYFPAATGRLLGPRQKPGRYQGTWTLGQSTGHTRLLWCLA